MVSRPTSGPDNSSGLLLEKEVSYFEEPLDCVQYFLMVEIAYICVDLGSQFQNARWLLN